MRTKLLVIGTAVALAALLPANGSASLSATEPVHYLVGFHGTPAYSVGDVWNGNPVVAVDSDLNFIVVETLAVSGLLAAANVDVNVRYVEPDASLHQLQLTPNDPLYGDAGHYGTKVTKIELAWDKTTGATSAKVGVVDSGIKATHEEFAARIAAQYDFFNNDATADDSGFCGYHGSHTAGTAAATINNGKGIAGVAQGSLVIAKIFQGKNPGPLGCSTKTTSIVNALKWTADQGAVVSSNSWGGGSSSTAINDAIQYGVDKGTTTVGAAGNSGACTDCVGQPWKDMGTYPGVLVVSCTDSADKFCSFSSEGPQVDVAAPGASILSVDGSGTTTYKKLSGTSMSTPHVSGVVALVKSVYPSETPSGVETRIKGSADDLGLSSDRQGAGRLDGQGAVA